MRSLDGLRGVAIALVLFFHYYVQTLLPVGRGYAWCRTALAHTACGVDLFFVLSGFLIGGILLDRAPAPNFLPVFFVRRALRILPVYLLLLVSFVVVRPLLAPIEPRYFALTVPWWSYPLFLQNNFMASAHTIGPWWLVATWSLAIEEQFYLLTPLIARALNRHALAVLCVAALLACPLLRTAALERVGNPLAAIYLLVARVDSLAAGGLVALAVRAEGVRAWLLARRRLLGWAVGAFALAWLAWPHIGGLAPFLALAIGPSFYAVGFALTLAFLVVAPTSPLARILEHPLLVVLGGVSYFVYLFHLPALYAAHGIVFRTPPLNYDAAHGAATLVALVATLVLALLSRRSFEQPLIRLGHRFQYRTR